MANYTEHLGLYRPSRSDDLDVDTTLSDNFVKLDEKSKSIDEELEHRKLQLGNTTFEYSTNGQIQKVTTPDVETTFTFVDGVLTETVEVFAEETVKNTFSYNGQGQLTGTTREVMS